MHDRSRDAECIGQAVAAGPGGEAVGIRLIRHHNQVSARAFLSASHTTRALADLSHIVLHRLLDRSVDKPSRSSPALCSDLVHTIEAVVRLR